MRGTVLLTSCLVLHAVANFKGFLYIIPEEDVTRLFQNLSLGLEGSLNFHVCPVPQVFQGIPLMDV